MDYEFSNDEKSVIRADAQAKPRGTYRTTCPACSQTRKNKRAQCLSVTVYPERVVMKCQHCEKSGATFLHEKAFIPPELEKPKFQALKTLDVGLTEAGIEFLTKRAISLRTAQVFSVASSTAYFRELGRDGPAIALPYMVGGKVHGHKVRCILQKDMICDRALSSLFGIQNVDLGESEDIIITEGEFDAMAFYEAEVLNAVSVPNGSSSFSRSNDDGTAKAQLGFLWEHKEIIDKAKRILIATDTDEAGDKLAEELARRIGKHRCWRVKYPEACKDANDVLMKYTDGKQRLRKAVEEAEIWPVEGLYEAQKYFIDVIDLYENGFGEKVTTGLAAIDGIFSVAPGLLTVVTGIPGNGKSTFVDQIMVNLARSKDYVSAICSFENPPAVHIGKLAAMLAQKHFFDTTEYGDKLTRKELDAILPYIHRHFKFVHRDDGKKADLAWVVESIKTAVFRWGVQIVVVDPYNYIARPAKMENETQWIDEMLTEMRLLAQLYGLHIFFVAHPTKMQMNSDGSHQMPKGYSISGSAAWFSKPDFGLTVHREQNGDVTIANWKTRYDWLGKVGEAKIFYDAATHAYYSDNFEVSPTWE